MNEEAVQARSEMLPLGYMAKQIVARPKWLEVPSVRDVCAVCSCLSADFCDYIAHWKHNEHWFFDSPTPICEIAAVEGVALESTRLFFYRGFVQQYDTKCQKWGSYLPADKGSKGKSEVVAPPNSEGLGFDVVTFSQQNAPEHSPLSCNHVASDVAVNVHCLFDTFDQAFESVESGVFDNAEPGPLRIIEVREVGWQVGQN